MSYAGPVSRAKHAASAAPIPPANARRSGSQPTPPGRRAASYSNDRRPIALFVAGIALGVAVGAGAALMFAPQTGDEARRALRRNSRRVARRGHDAWDDLRDELRRASRRRLRALRNRSAARGAPGSPG